MKEDLLFYIEATSVFSIQNERDSVPLGLSLLLALAKIRGRVELLYFEENTKKKEATVAQIVFYSRR